MEDNFARVSFEKIFNIEKIITIFYMEGSILRSLPTPSITSSA